jgi:2-dehydro-3-deoxyphosphooctonate aldolase (KDO 8-P synthase)
MRATSEMIVGGDLDRSVRIGAGAPLVLIGGPCVIEDSDQFFHIARGIDEICRDLGMSFVYKASFDKANRTSIESYRGPELAQALSLFSALRAEGIPVTTDVHLPSQIERVAPHVDLLQIPAFLCRQTDLLTAAGQSGRPVNIKKGQFMAPLAMKHAAQKAEQSGASAVMLTERGTTFGHGDLVVDMRGLQQMRELGYPVCFDATHSVQRPSAGGSTSGGAREFVPALSRAAVAVGIDALFAEIHHQPQSALSDGPNMIPLDELADFLVDVLAMDHALRKR